MKKYFTFKLTKTIKTTKDIDFDDFILNNFKDIEMETTAQQLLTIELDDENPIPKFIDLPSETRVKEMIDYVNSYIERKNFLTSKKLHYRSFKIPKRHGGYRDIIDPEPELKSIQRMMLDFLQNECQIQIHNCAHAFTCERDMYTNAYCHKDNTFFITLDVKSFFPSITEKILYKQFEKNYTLSVLNKKCEGLIKAIIDIATLDGALPQGSPLSPYLSNIVMTEFDFTVCKEMRLKHIPYYTYTRYADDMCFSAKALAREQEFPDMIQGILDKIYDKGIQLNNEKTKILKNTNRVYITGIKINKDNEATYGHEHKDKLKLELYNMFKAEQNNTLCKQEVQEILGKFAFMKRIEPNYANYLERKILKEFGSNCQKFSDHFKRYLNNADANLF